MPGTRRPRTAPAVPADPKPAVPQPASPLDDGMPPLPDDAVEVARVIGAWGVKGGIKLKPFSADPQALFSSKRWWLLPAGQVQGAAPAPRPVAPVPRLLRVVQAREQGDAIVATCHDLTDRDAAEALKGARVFVSRASFPTPAADEFYWVDLIGLAVRNRAGLDLGTVTNLIETGPHCVLCVQPAAAEDDEVLIPFVDAYVDRVDRDARVIHVDWSADY
jgi:16S rRNA processing protein RimM